MNYFQDWLISYRLLRNGIPTREAFDKIVSGGNYQSRKASAWALNERINRRRPVRAFFGAFTFVRELRRQRNLVSFLYPACYKRARR